MSKPPRLEILRSALANLRDENSPPTHLVDAAIALHQSAPLIERFMLRAAASQEAHQGLLCSSQSGLWTLEVFVGQSPADRAAERGQVLLSVDPGHRATYEGRMARIFVVTPGGERVLAEAAVRDGELCADIALAGLDLHLRDAINAVFGAAASP
jgi:hypothetical protein